MTEKTIYTFTDDGTGVPSQITDLSCSNGGGDRCSGAVSCTPANTVLGDVITCTVPGPARLLMLVGSADVSFVTSSADESSCYNPTPDAVCLALKAITLLRFPTDSDNSGAGLDTNEGKLQFIGRNLQDNSGESVVPDMSQDNNEEVPKDRNININSITQVTNGQARYVTCGANAILTGSLYINNLAALTKGLYIGGCSAASITAIDDRTWDNGVAINMITLNLDDTNFVTPPSLAKLVNLERLSIAGDVNDGLLTSLPDITALIALKYFNISKHAGITTIPTGYFDTNVLLEEIVLQRNGLTALPDNIFKYNVNLKLIDLGGNLLTVASLKESLFATLPLVTHLDLSDNLLVVNEANPLVSTLFDENMRLSHMYLQGNSIEFLSHLQFQHNLLLSLLAMGSGGSGGSVRTAAAGTAAAGTAAAGTAAAGTAAAGTNRFRTLTVCPTGYYRTQVFMPSIENGQAVYYGCDLCSMDGTDDAYSWCVRCFCCSVVLFIVHNKC